MFLSVGVYVFLWATVFGADAGVMNSDLDGDRNNGKTFVDGRATSWLGFFNPFMPSGLFYLKSLDWSISKRKDVCLYSNAIMIYGNFCI